MKKAILFLLLIGTLVLLVSCAGRSQSADKEEGINVVTAMTAQYRKISPQLAKQMMDSEEPVTIVDVRTKSEFNSGHIRDAILLPNESITTAERPQELPDTDATILVYCRSGNRSAQASRKLVSLGYVNVYDFGGINTWPYELVQ